jgi:hypothetical protein
MSIQSQRHRAHRGRKLIQFMFGDRCASVAKSNLYRYLPAGFWLLAAIVTGGSSVPVTNAFGELLGVSAPASVPTRRPPIRHTKPHGPNDGSGGCFPPIYILGGVPVSLRTRSSKQAILPASGFWDPVYPAGASWKPWEKGRAGPRKTRGCPGATRKFPGTPAKQFKPL